MGGIVRSIVAGSSGGTDTSSGDATASDILSGKKAWVDGSEVTGTYTLAAATATGDAATQHIKTGKKAWVDGSEVTGTAFTPAMMQFNGSSGYYSDLFTSSGNKVTNVFRFKRASFTGNAVEAPFFVRGPTPFRVRAGFYVYSSDYATAAYQSKLSFQIQNSAGTNICQLYSSAVVCDGGVHTVFASFDGDAGTAVFYIDGINADDTGAAGRVAPTTGTLQTGASSIFNVGENAAAASLYFEGDIGYVGHRQAYLTNWSDFMYSDGLPKALNESTWAEWGGGSSASPLPRPLYWHEGGYMQGSLGAEGAMTANGAIVMGKGGNT